MVMHPPQFRAALSHFNLSRRRPCIVAMLFVALVLGFNLGLSAQTHVAASQKAHPAPGNAANGEILKLIQNEMPENIVLSKIHELAGKFDISTEALIALKKAGATDSELNAVASQGQESERHTSLPLPPPPPPPALHRDYETVEETIKYIDDRLSNEGKVKTVESILGNSTLTSFTSNQHLKQTGSCMATYTNESDNYESNLSPGEKAYDHNDQYNPTIYLSEADPLSITQIEEGDGWKLQIHQDVPGDPRPCPTCWFAKWSPEIGYFSSKEAMLRVANAYIHAITLCHSK